MRVGTEHITSTRPTPDRFVYTVEYGDWRLTVPEQDPPGVAPACAVLNRGGTSWLVLRAPGRTAHLRLGFDRLARRGPFAGAFDRGQRCRWGERDRTYPRSVGVLGHGFLAEPVLQRLLGALPAATHISTYGRNPDLLTQLQRLGAKRAASPQISPHAANTSSCCCISSRILRPTSGDRAGCGLGPQSHDPWWERSPPQMTCAV